MPETLDHLDEWGLGGRNFGSWMTWFLIGGDLYTAYTFVAVPALVFGAGAIGFFAVPYTIVVYPMVFLVLIRLWSVSHVHGFVTPADFVRARHGSSTLALLVAITGIVATMPYIALQLVGIEAVLKAMGVTGHVPIIVAFAILAAYTYNSGLRAPALIAFVKDTLIYLVIIVAVIVIPYKLGGWDEIFGAAEEKFTASPNPGDGVILGRPGAAAVRHAGLRLRARAVPLPALRHRRARVARPQRHQAQHGGIAGLQLHPGPARAARLHGDQGGDRADRCRPRGRRRGRQQHDRAAAVPARCSRAGSPASPSPPSASARWCPPRSCRSPRPTCGRATSTGSTSTRTRHRSRRPRSSKLASLVVKVGALVAILALDPQFSIDLQLIGGIIILQTLPAVALGLYTGWFHRWGLIAGWAAGMAVGFWTTYQIQQKVFNPDGVTIAKEHFGGSGVPAGEAGLRHDVDDLCRASSPCWPTSSCARSPRCCSVR